MADEKAVQAALDHEDVGTLRHYYSQMLLLRRFEERTSEMYVKAKIGGYCHLNLGEEATIVGLMAALTPDDYIFTNYREHGYILARGVDPAAIMAELFGKKTGVAGGRGGSMHMFSEKAHFMGGYAIVGGQVPLAVGAAYALKYQGKPGVVVAQMGDATTNIGAFYESLNLAKLWKLPVLFFVVNNGYGMGTSVENGSSEPDLYKKGGSFRIHGERIDGTDVLAVRDAVRRLRQRAEQEGEPAILEMTSFRFRGHSVIDADRYRDADAVRRGREAFDPVRNFGAILHDNGMVDDAFLRETAALVDQEVQEAIDFANGSPEPEVKDMYTFMYATPVPNTPDAQDAIRAVKINRGDM
ncbi:MAG: pyruvate dehydrogenase (acetyl-transferring) E1 component subunit alpha [Chloroflexales bacterium]